MAAVSTLKPTPAGALPDSSESAHHSVSGGDLYLRYKSLERALEFVDIQEEYIRGEVSFCFCFLVS